MPLPFFSGHVATWANELVASLLAHRDEQMRIHVVDVHVVGTAANVRIEPAAAVDDVILHQQTTAVYDAAAGVEQALGFTAQRIRDVQLQKANGRYLWVIPVQKPRTGGLLRFDGVKLADHMRKVDLGA